MRFLEFFISIIINGHCADAANLLFIVAPGSDSHRRSMYPLAQALGRRNHSVTMFMEGKIGTNKIPDEKEHLNISMIMEFVKSNTFQLFNQMRQTATWNLKSFNALHMHFPWKTAVSTTEALMLEKFDNFNQSILSQKWDLIIVDSIITPTGLLTSAITNAPTAVFHTLSISAGMSIFGALSYPSSTMPALFIFDHYYDHKIFWQRYLSAFSDFLDIIMHYFVDKFVIQSRLKVYSNNVSLQRFFYNSKYALVDLPKSLDYPRPVTSDYIYIGAQCTHLAVLGNDNAKFLKFVDDPSSNGTIVIAFGHMVQWKVAPTNLKIVFIKTLNRLTGYKIIWQNDDNLMQFNLSSHVLIAHWIPQEFLLQHAKTKLFISHGGLKSLKETICAGVPPLIIPLFAEQIRNAVLLQKQGASITLGKLNITEEELFKNMQILLNNPLYHDNIRRLSSFFTDQIRQPLDNGIFWTEFFLKHGEHLSDKWFKTRGSRLAYYKYIMLDVMLLIISCILLLMIIVYKILNLFSSLTT